MAPWPLGRSRSSSQASKGGHASDAAVQALPSAPATPTRPTGSSNTKASSSNQPRLNSQTSRNGSTTSSAYVARASMRAGFTSPPSPTSSARSLRSNVTDATRASQVRWGEEDDGPVVVITRADMKNSLDTYDRLLAAAKQYRIAMFSLASATSNFASALEDCARQKGATHSPQPSRTGPSTSLASSLVLESGLHSGGTSRSRSSSSSSRDDQSHPSSTSGQRAGHDDSGELVNGDSEEQGLHADSTPGERLMAASGLHHMMSNQQQLLSDTFYKSFEIPLLENYDTYRRQVQDRQLQHRKETDEKSKIIRETEAENMRLGRKKERDFASFRRALALLQSQAKDLEKLEREYYGEVLEGEQETWEAIAGKVALVCRSQIDSADRIVTKASSDTMIESMVQTILDPFNAYALPKDQEEGHIFSILTPLAAVSSPGGTGLYSSATAAGAATMGGSNHHPAHTLARTRTSQSASVGPSSATSGATGQQQGESDGSSAKVARWAKDQQKRRTDTGRKEEEGEVERLDDPEQPDTDQTPRRATRRKDQLSWISENGDEGDELEDGEARDEAGDNQGTIRGRPPPGLSDPPQPDRDDRIVLPEAGNPIWR